MVLRVTQLFLPLALLLCEFATLMENGSGVGAELVGGAWGSRLSLSACPPQMLPWPSGGPRSG